MTSIQIASWTSKSQFVAQNVTLVLNSFSANLGGHAAAHAAKTAAMTAKAAAGAKPGAPVPTVPAAIVAAGAAVPLHGQLAVYPTDKMPAGGGVPTTPPLETVSFTLADVTKMPAGTDMTAQIFAALMLQAPYSAGKLVTG